VNDEQAGLKICLSGIQQLPDKAKCARVKETMVLSPAKPV